MYSLKNIQLLGIILTWCIIDSLDQAHGVAVHNKMNQKRAKTQERDGIHTHGKDDLKNENHKESVKHMTELEKAKVMYMNALEQQQDALVQLEEAIYKTEQSGPQLSANLQVQVKLNKNLAKKISTQKPTPKGKRKLIPTQKGKRKSATQIKSKMSTHKGNKNARAVYDNSLDEIVGDDDIKIDATNDDESEPTIITNDGQDNFDLAAGPAAGPAARPAAGPAARPTARPAAGPAARPAAGPDMARGRRDVSKGSSGLGEEKFNSQRRSVPEVQLIDGDDIDFLRRKGKRSPMKPKNRNDETLSSLRRSVQVVQLTNSDDIDFLRRRGKRSLMKQQNRNDYDNVDVDIDYKNGHKRRHQQKKAKEHKVKKLQKHHRKWNKGNTLLKHHHKKSHKTIKVLKNKKSEKHIKTPNRLRAMKRMKVPKHITQAPEIITEAPIREAPNTENEQFVANTDSDVGDDDYFKPLGGKPIGPIAIKEKLEENFLKRFSSDPEKSVRWEEPVITDNCWIQAMLAMHYRFSPNCNPNGTFAAKQCYLERCWCVNRDGTSQSRDKKHRFYYKIAGAMLECTQNAQ